MRVTSRRNGFTLVELLITIGITSVLTTTLGTAMQTAMGLYRSTSASLNLERRVETANQRIRSELSNARLITVAPTPVLVTPGIIPWTEQIRFRTADGWGAGNVVSGSFTAIGGRMDPAELDDGVDQDGDGLIDEWEVFMVQDFGTADAQTVVLATSVLEWFPGETQDASDENGNGLEDEPGVSFTVENGVLTVRLAMGTRRPDGALATRTRTMRVRLEN